jgi:thymidylate synthase (FAD)
MIHKWAFENRNAVHFDEEDNLTFTAETNYDGIAELVKIKGGDRRILKSARVSSMANNDGMKSVGADRQLIKYLWENNHHSPFEQVTLTFTVVCDLRTAMQMDTHRTMTKNRYSRRYSHDWVDFIAPVWRVQNTEKGTNKQAGDQPVGEPQGRLWTERWEKSWKRAVDDYRHSIQEGMAREQAAYFLPTGVQTATYYTVTLRHLLNFTDLRAEFHAQKEVQEIAYCLRDNVIPLTNPWVSEMLKRE